MTNVEKEERMEGGGIAYKLFNTVLVEGERSGCVLSSLKSLFSCGLSFFFLLSKRMGLGNNLYFNYAMDPRSRFFFQWWGVKKGKWTQVFLFGIIKKYINKCIFIIYTIFYRYYNLLSKNKIKLDFLTKKNVPHFDQNLF